jgi:hypothetical protein
LLDKDAKIDHTWLVSWFYFHSISSFKSIMRIGVMMRFFRNFMGDLLDVLFFNFRSHWLIFFPYLDWIILSELQIVIGILLRPDEWLWFLDHRWWKIVFFIWSCTGWKWAKSWYLFVSRWFWGFPWLLICGGFIIKFFFLLVDAACKVLPNLHGGVKVFLVFIIELVVWINEFVISKIVLFPFMSLLI